MSNQKNKKNNLENITEYLFGELDHLKIKYDELENKNIENKLKNQELSITNYNLEKTIKELNDKFDNAINLNKDYEKQINSLNNELTNDTCQGNLDDLVMELKQKNEMSDNIIKNLELTNIEISKELDDYKNKYENLEFNKQKYEDTIIMNTKLNKNIKLLTK
jgi:hypothetical protein